MARGASQLRSYPTPFICTIVFVTGLGYGIAHPVKCAFFLNANMCRHEKLLKVRRLKKMVGAPILYVACVDCALLCNRK